MTTKAQAAHPQTARPTKSWLGAGWSGWILAALRLLVLYAVIRNPWWWWLGAAVIIGIELRGYWGRRSDQAAAGELLWRQLPALLIGLSVLVIELTLIRMVTQLAVLALFGGWLAWRQRQVADEPASFADLLLVQAVMFEAIFLSAVVWQMPSWLVLVFVWLGSYFSVYSVLKIRGDRSAGVMAATWGVIATEISWVLQLWFVTYVMNGGYVLVPQPALILTALAYVLGNILMSSRQGVLSRARLGEYLTIGFILIMIVVAEILLRHNS